jgi:type IX secretion system PorP/SprF family membrane protein
MKKLLYILVFIVATTLLKAQQIPLSENYFMDRYSLSPSYAGNFNAGYIITGYRSDWTGIDGGPKTMRLTYNNLVPFMKNTGYGGKIIYDKAGIFSQLYISGSYSYNLKINKEHNILFGLSMGLYKNRVNLLDYYNDPNYTIDPSLINQDIKSRMKFISDVSAVWTWQGIEAGLMFSNITFGNAHYKEVNLKYNPLTNFQFHATYQYNVNKDWDINPLLIIRGGKYVKSQFELSTQVIYTKKFWGSIVFRDPQIWGFGAGAYLAKGLKLAYNFNLASNVSMGAFNNHEISIGVNLQEYIGKKNK